MRRKIRMDRVLLLVATLLLVVLLLIAVIRGVGGIFSNDDHKPNDGNKDPENSEVDEEVDTFQIDLVDYEVYKTDRVDFNFVLARFRLRDPKAIKYSLSSLYTDEKTVKLDDYAKYRDALEKEEIYLGTKNVAFDLTSSKKSEIFTIFIPYMNEEKDTLSVYDAITKKEFKFNLNENLADVKDLEYHTGADDPIQMDDLSIKVNDAYIGSMFVQNNVEYSYPSSVQIYVFALDVYSLTNESPILEDAIFVNENGEEVHALDASITCVKINNLMNSKLHSPSPDEPLKGGLFFEMYNPNGSEISYNGTLKLKFSNSENWLSIKTELD